MQNKESLLADCISYNSVGQSFHSEYSLAIHVELQWAPNCILLCNIRNNGNNQGTVQMTPDTSLFTHMAISKQCFNPFPNKLWFLRVCSTSLLKTLREKEQLLVTSNFSFSHIVFYPLG